MSNSSDISRASIYYKNKEKILNIYNELFNFLLKTQAHFIHRFMGISAYV